MIPTFTIVSLIPSWQGTHKSHDSAILIIPSSTPPPHTHTLSFARCSSLDLSQDPILMSHPCPLLSKAFSAPPFFLFPFPTATYIYFRPVPYKALHLKGVSSFISLYLPPLFFITQAKYWVTKTEMSPESDREENPEYSWVKRLDERLCAFTY